MRVPVIVEEQSGLARVGEPVGVGIPLVRGAAGDTAGLRLVDEGGEPLAAQLTPLGRWSDDSIKWLFVEVLLDVDPKGTRELALVHEGGHNSTDSALGVEATTETVTVSTGAHEATLARTGSALLTSWRIGDAPVLDEAEGLQLRLVDDHMERHELSLTSVDVTAAGPVRGTVTLRGRLGERLEVVTRISFWAGRGLARLDVTLSNPAPAQHAGGTWDLGDPGSVLFRDVSLETSLAGERNEPRHIAWTDAADGPLQQSDDDWLEVYQDSSGGERWDFKNHVNRDARLPVTFRGYRVCRNGGPRRRGERAEPSLWLSSGDRGLGATVKDFWQSFPKALEADADRIVVRLWPGQFSDLHELQGGEQKTHTVWLSAEEPGNLGWTQTPLTARSTPEHYVSAGVFPHLVAWADDGNAGLLQLAVAVLDADDGLVRRRELIDEYGWRNFGDVFADHENVGNEDALPRVSHYNNQYDGIFSALAQFVRSGDARWFRFADELARHVADIDIYHTQGDRSAFSGGLFWHTDHYTDAATSTHRCYTRRCPQAETGSYGGGPAAEHDYAGGLATHYFMTGWLPSREGALSLARWVIDVDEPEDTLVGRLLPGSPGLATRTDDHSYHGPGRGAGNSIETLLDGLELTGDDRYLLKAEELLRRCVHPDDDRDAFELLTNPEIRWSYTVLLLALLRYLEVKVERDDLDEAYAYGQATLAAYARWMLEHEGLSSERRNILEIWTESWPAQDMRKGLILMEAARHVSDDSEKLRLFERGRELFAAAGDELLEWETKTLARPLFLVMRYGYQGSALAAAEELTSFPIVEARHPGKPSGFVPWKGKPKALIRTVKQKIKKLRGE